VGEPLRASSESHASRGIGPGIPDPRVEGRPPLPPFTSDDMFGQHIVAAPHPPTIVKARASDGIEPEGPGSHNEQTTTLEDVDIVNLDATA
jgi:hypothetical protein